MVVSFILAVVGVVLVVEGIPWFLSPEKTRFFLAQVQLMSNRQLRIYGVVMMAIGLLVVRLATR